MIKAEEGRITYIVGPDGELCTADATGHWCNEPEESGIAGRCGSVEGAAEEKLG